MTNKSMIEIEVKDFVSIIVPIYNIATFLPRCLKSIAEQSYRYIEVILVDDGSTDGSSGICDEMAKNDDRFVVIHQANGGVSNARNVGKQIAKSEWIMFVDGDDWLHPNAIEALIQASYSEKESVDIVIGCHQRVYDELANYPPLNKRYKKTDSYKTLSFIFCHNQERLHAKLFKRATIADLWFSNYTICEDHNFVIWAVLKANLSIIYPDIIYYYYQRPNSTMHSNNSWSLFYNNYPAILYRLYIDISKDNIWAKPLLLSRLYDTLPNQKLFFSGKAEAEEFAKWRQQCISKTWRTYLLSPRINLVRKIRNLLMYINPHINRLYIKLAYIIKS